MAIDLKKVELAEKAFTLRLTKEFEKTGVANDIVAQVKFVPDISGSMGSLYKNGTVNSVVSRMFVAAFILDDDKKMEVFPFSEKCEKLSVEVTDKNFSNFVETEILGKRKDWYFERTEYAPMIKKVVDSNKHSKIPQLIICVVDGDADDKISAENLIIKSAETPTFFFFIGIGDSEKEFSFLKRLDDIPASKRKIDNVDFKYIKDINKLSDEDLYELMAEEFIPWFYEAKRIGIF